jgi:hypothetical protein
VLVRLPSDIIFIPAENFDDAGLLLREWFLKIKAHCWKVTSDFIVSVLDAMLFSFFYP